MQPELNVYIVDSPGSFNDLVAYVEEGNHEILSFDLETDGVIEKTANLYGIGLSFTNDTAFYIPVRTPTGEFYFSKDEIEHMWDIITSWCASHKLIGWNILYDVLVWEYNTGNDISSYIYADAMLQKHTLNEERPFGLKECAVAQLGSWADKAKERMVESVQHNGGTTTKDNFQMFKADTDVLGEYCGWDTLLCRRLFDIYEAQLKSEGLAKFFYEEEVMPLYQVTIDMKRHGFTVDVDYFEKLKAAITEDINKLESEIYSEISPDTLEFNLELLDKDYPVSRKGLYAKCVADYYKATLPMKGDKITLAKAALEKEYFNQPHNLFYKWILGHEELDPTVARMRQYELCKTDSGRAYPFNLHSNDHLGWLLFTKLKEKPAKKTETGKPQVNDDYLETLKDKYGFISKLLEHKKLNKLLSTYIEGVLERHVDGVIYSSMLQHGTTSGRYSSTNPNLQNLPRQKEDDSGLSELVLHYANAIKKGFIAPPGYVLVGADYGALEPRSFAHVSGDETLKQVYINGYDLYSQIAIDTWGLYECSADPKASNYLKKKHPEKRQLAKIFVLAVVYGAEAGRIAQAMGIEYIEAQQIIESYLEAYPGLQAYMEKCDSEAKRTGIIKTEFGRVRHLPFAKSIHNKYGDKLLNPKWAKMNGLADTRYLLKNALNNSKNFPIQGLAGHIINRAMIRTRDKFITEHIDGYVALMVHDEIICAVKKDKAEQAREILKDCMENTTKISVPLVAEPNIGHNLAETK